MNKSRSNIDKIVKKDVILKRVDEVQARTKQYLKSIKIMWKI